MGLWAVRFKVYFCSRQGDQLGLDSCELLKSSTKLSWRPQRTPIPGVPTSAAEGQLGDDVPVDERLDHMVSAFPGYLDRNVSSCDIRVLEVGLPSG